MINNKYKILVVEDEDNINNLLKALLETNGYQVITAKDCKNADTFLKTHISDLVIDYDARRVFIDKEEINLTQTVEKSNRFNFS